MREAAGPFKVILSALNGAKESAPRKLTFFQRFGIQSPFGQAEASRVTCELAKLFKIDEAMAENIVQAVPIVILDGLDGRTAELVRERLWALKEAGCQVVVTDAPTENIPRINWPEPPSITQRDSP